MDAGTTYQLRHPVLRPDGVTVTTLTFKPILGEHIMDMPIGASLTMEHLLGIASKITGEHLPVFKQMQAIDAMAVAQVVGTFLGSGPATSGK